MDSGAEPRRTSEEADGLPHESFLSTVGAGLELEGCKPQPQSNEDVDVEEAEATVQNADATEDEEIWNDEKNGADDDVEQNETRLPKLVQIHVAMEEEEEEEGKKKDDTPEAEDAAQPSTRRPRFVPPRAALEEEEEEEEERQEKQSLLSVQRPERTLSHRLKISERHLQDESVGLVEDDKKLPFRWYHAAFLFSIASLIVCLLQLFTAPPFGVWMTSAEIEDIEIAPEGCEDGLKHCICPRETICATNTYSIVLLALARCSAFFDYPLYMMMFLSKCHNINNICRRTVLREWIEFSDMHKVHRLFGVVVGIETMSHSFFHLLRWGLNGDISLLWESNTGITGLITMIITPLVCWPMFVPALKQNMKFELRKGLHYLAVVWAIALLWHAPSRIYYLIGIPALIYAVDYLFGFFIRNTLIENAHFERYGENGVAVSSVLTLHLNIHIFILPRLVSNFRLRDSYLLSRLKQLHFKNPKSWGERPKTSYVYIMCPWISKHQWHAFTMFPEPTKKNHTMLCIGASGDWTRELHDVIKAPSYKSLYVLGPYLSEFSDKAVTTSNAIAVASGIGITPTLSLMLNYAGKKRVNIIWMCRDAGLVEYILHKVDIEAITKNSYAFIYYTGKRELALPQKLPLNLFIINSRPDLEESITGIVAAIHSGEDLPEELYEAQLEVANVPFQKRMQVALCRVLEIYGADDMFEYAVEETQKEIYKNFSTQAEMNKDDLENAPMKLKGDRPRTRRRSILRHSILATPEDSVSLRGLDAMISEFCGGIGEYSGAELEEIFNKFDRHRTGFIDREDYDAFLGMMTENRHERRQSTEALSAHMDKILMKSLQLHSKSVRNVNVSLDRFQSHQRLHTMRLMKTMIDESDNNAFRDWSIFYCGGSTAIKKNLKEIAKKYGLAFAVEKFDW